MSKRFCPCPPLHRDLCAVHANGEKLVAFADLVLGNARDLYEYGEEELRARLKGLGAKAAILLREIDADVVAR